jgi:predicted molibdopterin-dependent oxidoreductase YjgC
VDGELKALYIMGENPVITDPHQHHTIEGLKNLEFLVVQDIFLTETAKYAHVVLPAACSFEKEGTFSNTERRVQRVRKAVTPPGEARDDLSIIMQLSRAMGYPMEYRSPEQVLEEFGKVWPALAGITYDRIKSRGIAWPCPTKDHPGTEFLYKDGFAKKIPFVPIAFNPPAETVCGNYPFVLTTGRNLFQYHSGSMSRRVAAIEKHAGEAYVEMNPADGKKLGIENGDMVRVRSRRGDVEIKARFTRRISAGTVFIPMHYREAAANVLTNDALDPDVLIPEFKVCAVEILPLKKKAGKEVAAGVK